MANAEVHAGREAAVAATVPDLLVRSAAVFGERPVVDTGDEQLSYAELERQSAAGAAFLSDHGVARGDRVGLCLEAGPDYLRAYFSILRAGAVVVPVHPGSGRRFVESTLAHAEARAAVLSGDDVSLAGLSASAVPSVRLVVWSNRMQRAGVDAEVAAESCWDGSPPHDLVVAADDLAAFFYTSGSTGQPKAVMLSHRNLATNTMSVVESLPIDEHERAGLVLPLCYAYGDSVLRSHVARGACLVKLPPAIVPAATVAALRRARCTSLSAVSMIFNLLVREPDFRSAALPSLRYLTHAGGPARAAMIDALRERFPTVPLICMYGQTEAGPRLACLPPDRLATKRGSIGLPVPGVELDVVDEGGRSRPDGEVGELVARGPNVMIGYWKDPERTSSVLKDGVLHTGDMAQRDADGFLSIVGRREDIIKAGSHRVDPTEVEQVIEAVPGVRECVVIGRPDEFMGERVVAYVVASDEAVDPIRAVFVACRVLSEYKRPVSVQRVDALPRGASGKLQRDRLPP